MICAVSNIYLTKSKRHAEKKLRQLKGELQTHFRNMWTCVRSDVTQTMATRSANVDMAAVWRMNSRKISQFANRGISGTFFENSM